MKSVKIGIHTVELYDEIDELSITRFHKYQKYLLIDSGIGSTMADFDKRIEKMRRFCILKDTDNAQKEMENLRQCVYMIQNGLSPQHLAFATLVIAVDGVQCTDITDDGLQKTLALLADAPVGDLTGNLDSVKKKIDGQLMLYFPKIFEDSTVKEFYDKMRRRTLLVLKNIVAGVAVDTPEIEQLTSELITYSHPQTFSGSNSAEIQFDRQFENLCIMLSEKLNVNPKQYSVLEFYNAFEFLSEKAKNEQEAANKARGRH